MTWTTTFTPRDMLSCLFTLPGPIIHAFGFPAAPTLQALRVIVTRNFAGRTRSTASATLPANTTALCVFRRDAATGRWRCGSCAGGGSSRSRGGSAQGCGLGGRSRSRSRGPRRATGRAAHPTSSDRNVVVPEGVGGRTVRLPAEVHARDLRDELRPGPPVRIGVGDAWPSVKTRYSGAVNPRLDGTISAEVVLKTLPRAGWKIGRGRNALRGEVWERCVVVLTVPHHDL